MADNPLEKYSTAIANAFRDLVRPENMRKYGEQAAAMIKLRTRLGQGVESDGAEKGPLKPLSPAYIKMRQEQQDTAESDVLTARFRSGKRGLHVTKKQLHGKGGLSDQTSPGKSNLTRTGQMLNSESVTSVGEGEVFVGPKGSRDDGKKNEDIAAYVTYAGRPFNNLSKIEVKRVNDAIKKDMKKFLAEALTKIRR